MTDAVPFWQRAPRSNASLVPVKRTSASWGPLLCTVTWNPSAGTALFSTTTLPWHATVIEPPAFEKVVVADPGVTEVAVCVVVVVVCPAGGVTVEVAGAVLVVVVTTVGPWRALGCVVVVGVEPACPRMAEVDGVVDGPVGSCVGEEDTDVVGTSHVVIAPRAEVDEDAARATPGPGMTGSGGEAIALVTAPTPTQLTAVAAPVATTQEAIESAVTLRIPRFSPLQHQFCTKPVIIRRPRCAVRSSRRQVELVVSRCARWPGGVQRTGLTRPIERARSLAPARSFPSFNPAARTLYQTGRTCSLP